MKMVKPVIVKELTLAQKTKVYWQLSSSYEGRYPVEFTFIQASKIIDMVSSTLGPERRLRYKMEALMQELIEQPPSKTSTSA